MNGKYVCEICKNEHSDVISYINCVTACGEKLKKEREEAEAKKYIEEVNAALNRIKEAEKYLKEVKKEFKEKYPREYELNFGENMKSPDYEKVKAVSKDEVEKDNGTLEDLLNDPHTRYLARMLGLL